MTHRRQRLRADSASYSFPGTKMQSDCKVDFAGIPSFHEMETRRKGVNRSLAHARARHAKASAIAHHFSSKIEPECQRLSRHWATVHQSKRQNMPLGRFSRHFGIVSPTRACFVNV
jgi:hypothetical protein